MRAAKYSSASFFVSASEEEGSCEKLSLITWCAILCWSESECWTARTGGDDLRACDDLFGVGSRSWMEGESSREESFEDEDEIKCRSSSSEAGVDGAADSSTMRGAVGDRRDFLELFLRKSSSISSETISTESLEVTPDAALKMGAFVATIGDACLLMPNTNLIFGGSASVARE